MNRRTFAFLFTAALGLLLIAQPAFAQPGRGPGNDGRGFGGGDMGLLNSEAIQKELDLSDDQVKELQELNEKSREMMREMFSGMQDIPREERREKFEEMRGEMEEKMKEVREEIDGVLLDNQKQRLAQIRTQMSSRRGRGRDSSGSGGLLNEDIAEKLGLSEEQKEEIREKAEASREKMRETLAELNKEALEDALGVLSAKQREQYEELFGDPFDFSAAFQRGGDRGGDQGGNRGRGGDRGGNDNARPRRPDADDDDA